MGFGISMGGGGAGGGGITKVADAAARLALTPANGDIVIQLDTDLLYEYDLTTLAWVIIGGVSPTFTDILVKGSVQFEDPDAGTNKVTVKASTALAVDWTLTLPVDDGANLQFLKTDGAGVTSWSAVVLTTDVSGILPVANGGTGLSGGTSGGVPYYSAAGTIAASAELTASQLIIGGGAGVAPSALGSLGTTTTVLHGNAAGAPTYGAVVLTTDVSGILPLANGGSNANLTAVNGGIVYSSASAMAISAAGTANQVLLSGGAGAPVWSTSVFPSGAITSPSVLCANTASTWTAVLGPTTGRFLRTSGTTISFQPVGLTTDVGTSILPMANGGSNKNMTAVNGGIIYSDADSMEVTAAGTANQVLVSAGAAAPVWTTKLNTQGTRQTGTSMSAGTAITATIAQDTIVFVVGNGGAVTITASPAVVVTSMVVGQILRICGTSDANTVTYNADNNLNINGSITLAKDNILTLMYAGSDGTNAAWIEVSRT